MPQVGLRGRVFSPCIAEPFCPHTALLLTCPTWPLSLQALWGLTCRLWLLLLLHICLTVRCVCVFVHLIV
ncbi:hypothetical protein E2C01_085211 [Portunus trituberculatus]|uniref:Uncharacterized protein n=1 Tax=Portunus trituberculatus TaxID=210409 RepID=A0A5B7J632_PORTR|nr:hypothetical protein [Portunus trituberculatus]